MSTRAEVRAQDEEATETANLIIDVVGATIVIIVALYLTSNYEMPDNGIELVLTVFFGAAFWLLVVVMLYKVVSLIFAAVAAEPET